MLAFAQPSVSVNGSLTVTAPAVVMVTITGGPGNASDYAGVYRTGAPNAQTLDWVYLTGTKQAPASGLTSATLTFRLGAPGLYEFRCAARSGLVMMASSR